MDTCSLPFVILSVVKMISRMMVQDKPNRKNREFRTVYKVGYKCFGIRSMTHIKVGLYCAIFYVMVHPQR